MKFFGYLDLMLAVTAILLVFVWLGMVVFVVVRAEVRMRRHANLPTDPFPYWPSLLKRVPHRHRWRRTYRGRQCFRCWRIEDEPA